MSDTPTLFTDVTGFCQLQELDPTKSNDFNKIFTFLKRTSKHALTPSNFVLSIQSFSSLSTEPKSSINSFEDFFFDKILQIILSFTVRAVDYEMKVEDEKHPNKQRILTIRGIISELYENYIFEGSTWRDRGQQTQFSKIANRMNLTLGTRLHMMDLLFEFCKDRKNYYGLNSTTYYYKTSTTRGSKHNRYSAQKTNSKNVPDSSLMALLHILIEQRDTVDSTITILRHLITQVSVYRSYCQSYEDIEWFTENSQYLRCMMTAMFGKLNDFYNNDRDLTESGKNEIIELALEFHKVVTDVDAMHYIFSNNYNLWSSTHVTEHLMPFYYKLANLENPTARMMKLISENTRDPRYINHHQKSEIMTIALNLSQRQGDFHQTGRFLRDSRLISAGSDDKHRITILLDTAITSAWGKPDKMRELKAVLVDAFRGRMERNIEGKYNEQKRPMLALKDDDISRYIGTAIGVLTSEGY
jgi:hypothetical protein